MFDLFPEDPRAAAIDAVHIQTGVFTRAAVVDQILHRIGWPTAQGLLLDPGAGDGIFLARAIAALAPVPGDTAAALRVRGLEFHPLAAAAARERVADTLVDLGWTRSSAQAVAQDAVAEADFLADGLPPGWPKPTTIAANPPYLRWLKVPEILRDNYDRTVPQHARADLLHAYIERIANILLPGGQVGMVTSYGWLTGAQAAGLREVVGRHLSIDITASERLDEASSFYLSKLRRPGTAPRVEPVLVVLRPKGTAGSSPVGRDPIWVHEPPEADGRPRTPLGDLATLTLGKALGMRSAFVLPAGNPLIGQLPPDFFIPVVGPRCLRPEQEGRPDEFELPPRHFGLRLPIREEPTHPAIRAHFANHLGVAALAKPDWWRATETPAPPLGVPAVALARVARKLRPAILPADVAAIDHIVVAIPKAPGWTAERLRDALRDPWCTAWVRSQCAGADGGHVQLKPYHLTRLPVATDA